mgnify:CR=1 FL=1
MPIYQKIILAMFLWLLISMLALSIIHTDDDDERETIFNNRKHCFH